MSHTQNTAYKRALSLGWLIIAILGLALYSNQHTLAQDTSWTRPTAISSSAPGYSWFPDIAIDEWNSVHVVWCNTVPLKSDLQEQVYYTRWDGQTWSEPNDIVPPSLDIVRNAITTDLAGNVHLLFGGSVYQRPFTLYYQKAPLDQAWSAAAWSQPHIINQGVGYMGDIAVDSRGTIHVIYDDSTRYSVQGEPAMSDIVYRHSQDGGLTWSTPVYLYPEPLIGAARPYLEIDSNDVLHVTWDSGWDRLGGGVKSDVYYSVYVSSSDRGQTWTAPTVIDYPDATAAQLTVGSDGRGGVLLVWRSNSADELFYQWSTDGGLSWGAPSIIPQLFARPWTTPFDMYDMATDSAGQIHLLVSGRQLQDVDALQGVYHLVWNGAQWSSPAKIFEREEFYPEYSKIVVHAGNQLYAVWFTREGNEWDSEAPREIWYSNGLAAAPHQPVTPRPTATPRPATATPIPTPTNTPYPTYSFDDTSLPGDVVENLYTESDEVLALLLALVPLTLLILVIIAVRTRWFGKLRR